MAPDARTQSGTRFLSDIHRRCALEFAQECAEFVWQGQPSAAHAATMRALKEFVTNMHTMIATIGPQRNTQTLTFLFSRTGYKVSTGI